MATEPEKEVWQPLLSGALQEFDHRVDLSRHQRLLEQLQVTTLISVERLVLAIQQEMRNAGRMSDSLESGRELCTIAYDLAAFTDSEGPYTLYEIYQTFSFCDKIQIIQDYATQEFRSRIRLPSGQEMGKGEAKEEAQEKSRWRPPDPAETKLFLRAGLQLGDADPAGQTPLSMLCEAACLCNLDYWFQGKECTSSAENPSPQDLACAETVRCLCQEAPATWSMLDKLGRTPLVVIAEAFGLASPQPLEGVPMATLKALLESLDICFSKSPSGILLALRYSSRLRSSTEGVTRVFLKEKMPQLERLFQWMDVVMGGAWEASEEQRHLTERLLMDMGPMDVEDMVNTSIHLRNFSEEMEKKVEQWEAEEAELKVLEFEATCAKRASQYEERIARLEGEIARRAGSLQLLPQPTEKGPEEPLKEPLKAEKAKEPKEPKAEPLPECRLEEAKNVVEEIRGDRLVTSGWDEGLSEEVKEGLLSMRRSLCAAVERLAMDLYADECHCLWELMQNADDNKYASDQIPELTLALEVEEDRAYVWTSNNELGLSPEDVRAICNVNASLKGAGQTGHKGIGWKSVFRISDCPHVLSNAFAFKFDTQGPLGRLSLVTPTNLSEEDLAALPAPVRDAKAAGNTVMFLPLRSKSDALAVDVELRQIAAQHLCLAFLRRLRRIRLRFTEGAMFLERSKAELAKLYFPEASNMVAVKITEYSKAGEKSRTQMPEYVLHHHDVALQGETAELTLAFPVAFALDASLNAEDEELLKAPLQPLFTFLPVKVLGFRFAIQGPFDLTADRANLHGKSMRNRSLCASVAVAFKAALQTLPGLRNRALDLLGQETPEATWLLVRGQLLEALRDVECIPTEPDGQLACPGECLLPPEEPLAEAMQLPPEVLWDCCGRRLVQRPWALRHRAQTRGLGLEELGIGQWLQVLEVDTDEKGPERRSLVKDAAEKQDHGFFKRLLNLLASSLGDKSEILEKLKRVPLLPDAAGNAMRIADGPLFSCYASDLPKSWQKRLEEAGALRVLCDQVHAALDSASQKFLRQLGVTRPSRQDMIQLCLSWHATLERRRNEADGKDGAPSADTTRCAAWASLACLRHHYLSGATPEVNWSELELLVPSQRVRSGFGPVKRLTSPLYLGAAAGSELQEDVLVAIMSFIHGKEADVKDIAIFADSPPDWLDLEKEKDLEKKEKEKSSEKSCEMVLWELFFDVLGMKALEPCGPHRKVAGTVLTIDLGWRLSSCDWWRALSSKALSYVEQRLRAADRVEITWLRQLGTKGQAQEVSELFLRHSYVRYGGHFLPYLDNVEPGVLGCLERLKISTKLNGAGLRKCLRALRRSCRDVAVYADVYAALQELPKAEQSSSGSWGAEDPAHFEVFIPPDSFEVASRCIWTDQSSCLRWLCGYHVLQPEYGRFGSACRSWLLGPHVGVQQDLNGLKASDFLAALRSLIEQADAASRLPPEERHKRMGGRDSPSATIFLQELQSTAVDAYKQLARCCTSPNAEERSQANGAVALAFQHEALIVITDKDWPKPKKLKTQEAFWDVHPDLASSKAAKLALKNRLPSDLDVLRKFFVDTVGVADSLTQQDLEARLRVPLSQETPAPSSWQNGLGLQDFEDFATLRRGRGVLGPGAGEEDFFCSEAPTSQGYPAAAAPSPSAPDAAPQAQRPEPAERNHDDAEPERTATPGPTEPSPPAAEPAPEEPEEEDDFDWDSEDVNDPYKVLRVDKDADDETIKRAYKKLALKYHPDKNRGSGALERFQAIAAAYETLRDPQLRKEYDAAAREQEKKHVEERKPPEPTWEANVSAEHAREMFQSFCREREPERDEEERPASRRAEPRSEPRAEPRSEPRLEAPVRSSAAPTAPHPAAQPAAQPAPQPERPGSAARKLSKEEYNELLKQLKEAEEEAQMWNDEVEVARQQLSQAEETRDRYLRILQECYDRTSR